MGLIGKFEAWIIFKAGRKFGFTGADDQFVDMVKNIRPGYEPWFKNILEPPSSEAEFFLFAVQAGMGAGFIGYFFGFYQGKKKGLASKNSK